MLVWRTEEAYITSTSNCSHDAARVDARSRRIWPTIRHLARKITRYKHVMYIFRRRRRRRRVLALKTGPARPQQSIFIICRQPALASLMQTSRWPVY